MIPPGMVLCMGFLFLLDYRVVRTCLGTWAGSRVHMSEQDTARPSHGVMCCSGTLVRGAFRRVISWCGVVLTGINLIALHACKTGCEVLQMPARGSGQGRGRGGGGLEEGFAVDEYNWEKDRNDAVCEGGENSRALSSARELRRCIVG